MAIIVILMGVCGSGKTTVGLKLKEKLGWRFYDGDDFHSEANRSKLIAGIPLTDADREPWLGAIASEVRTCIGAGQSAIFACSALRETYRSILNVGPEVRFVLLNAPKSLLADRLANRSGNFMNPGLLDDQLATLEYCQESNSTNGRGVLVVDVSGTADMAVNDVLRKLEL